MPVGTTDIANLTDANSIKRNNGFAKMATLPNPYRLSRLRKFYAMENRR
jgi:hypothetical protein